MTLDIILFRKKKSKLLHTFALRFFVYLLLSLTNEWPHTTLSLFEEDALEYILRAKIWLDGFDNVFWRVSVEFLFVVFLLSFFCRLQNRIRIGPNALL